MLTATGMRHHIATMSQIHSRQGDEYTEQLPGFFGMTSRFTLKTIGFPYTCKSNCNNFYALLNRVALHGKMVAMTEYNRIGMTALSLETSK